MDQKLSRNLHYGLIGILFLAIIVAYFPIMKGLVSTWYGYEEYSHGFLVLPFCFYIIWRKRHTLSALPIETSRLGLPLIIFSLLLYLLSHFAEIMTTAYLSLPLFASGIIMYFFGLQIYKELIFPVFFMLFMIPVPSQIYSSLTIPLQLFVSNISVLTAKLLGISVYREGNVILNSNFTLQVVNACSGLRTMISLMFISSIFAYFTLKSNFMKAVLLVSGIPVAVIVNIIRILVIVAALYYFKYDLTTGGGHTLLGVFIFFLALFIIALIKGVLSIWDDRQSAR
jgi:exosortase